MKFQFRLGLAVAVSISFAILVSLGVWQLKRLEWKRGIIAQMSERLGSASIPFGEALAREARGENLEYQPVFIEGAYAHDLESAVFGTYEGAPGVYIFTPLAAADDSAASPRYVFVNRGFAPQEFRDSSARLDGLVAGDVRVEGLFRHAERRRGFEKVLAPLDQPEDNLFFIRDPSILAAPHKIDVPAFYIDGDGRENKGAWPRGGVTRTDIPNRHLEYALTWFGLAAALLCVFLAYSVRRD